MISAPRVRPTDRFPSLPLAFPLDLSLDIPATSPCLGSWCIPPSPPLSVSLPIFSRLIQLSQEAEETLIQCEPGQTHVVCDGREREVVRKKIRDALVSCLSKF